MDEQKNLQQDELLDELTSLLGEPEQEEKAPKERRNIEKKPKTKMTDLLKSIIVLGCIAIGTTLLLTVVYQLTSPVIIEAEGRELDAALRTVLPENAEITTITNPESLLTYVTDIYSATDGDTLLGYAVLVKTKGYGGEIVMIVGISPEKKVTGVKVLSHKETKDIGTDALDADYLNQFALKDGSVATISGATISSAAIKAGVENAVAQIDIHLQEQDRKAELAAELAVSTTPEAPIDGEVPQEEGTPEAQENGEVAE